MICSNDVIPTNADGVMGFKQNSDLFYLTGIDQEDTILLLFPDHVQERNREVLFIRESNDHLKIWEGEKLSKEEARELSGIKTVLWTHQFDAWLKKTAPEATVLYLNINEHDGRNESFISKQDQFNLSIKNKYPLHKTERLAPLLSEMRLIKHPEEIEKIEQALDITTKGFQRLCRELKPGVPEYELEAHLTHEFLLRRSRGYAFPPIIASGKNACVLHYVTNNDSCKAGELVLLDFGAEYANYNADITRVLPVGGRFNDRQREVYQAVLNVFYFTRSRLIPGNTMDSLRTEVGQFLEDQLIQIGLLTEQEVRNQNPDSPLYRKYFPHGVSHSLGLDVHDVGGRSFPFCAGMVLTCEPGIYIPEEGIGIRLENDILLTETGNRDLCEGIPLEIDEIEALFTG